MSRRKFNKEFKIEAVKLILDDELPICQIARELSVHANSLYRWVNNCEHYDESVFFGNGTKLYDYKAEIYYLERWNREFEEEVKLLENFGTYCRKRQLRFSRSLVKQKHRYAIKKVCTKLGILPNGFSVYHDRQASYHKIANEFLSKKIREVFEQHGGRYGAKRIIRSLQEEGTKVNRKRLTKLMNYMGLHAKGSSRVYKNYNNKYANKKAWPDMLKQTFVAAKRNKIWVGNIRYIPTQEGYQYLTTFLDMHMRKIVVWYIASMMMERFAIDSFLHGCGKENPRAGLVVHRDQGPQFIGGNFLVVLESKGAVPSHRRKANPYDNVPIESFYKTLKRELVNSAGLKTKDQARQVLVNHIKLYYNSMRKYSTLGLVAPREYEELNSQYSLVFVSRTCSAFK